MSGGYRLPPKSDKRGRDGQRTAQGAVTTDYLVVPIPSKPLANRGKSTGHYYAGPPGSESVILRFDLAIVDRSAVHETTSSGPSKTAAFASFGNRPLPDPADPDEFCNRYAVVGFHKNNLTDPESGNFRGNMGTFRANSKTSAVQVAGGVNMPYTCPKQLNAGDPVLWMPPNNNNNGSGSGSGSYSFGPESDKRALPYLAPLHWSLVGDMVHNVNLAALHHQVKGVSLPSHMRNPKDYGQDSSKGTWKEAAREKIRMWSAVAGSFATVWIQRGYVQALTPTASMLAALKEKFEAEVIAAAKGGDIAEIQAVTQVYENQKKRYVGSFDSKSFDEDNRHELFYYDPNRRDVGAGGVPGIYSVNRETEHYVDLGLRMSGGDTSSASLNKERMRGNSIEWMLQNLALDGSYLGHGDPSSRKTNYDAMRLCCSGSLPPAEKVDVQQYLKVSQDYVNPQSSSICEAFKGHLEACHVGETVCYHKQRGSIMSRQVGRALTSSIGTPGPVDPNNGPTVDIDFGQHAL